jgi:hypothetical protein
MERSSTFFLRGVVILIGLIVLALCVFVLPVGISSDNVGGYRPILLGMYVTAIPFYIALYHTLKLLHLIDNNKAFSELSVQALGYIKYCATIIGVLYALGMPYIYLVADRDDAPGVVALGLAFTFTPMVIAVFAAVLQRLLHNAIAIKSENDLTV